MKNNIIFDYSTARTTDVDGRLHVVDSKISAARINDYLGSEIPQSEELGLDPSRLYRVYRDASALRDAAASFEHLPLMDEHIAVSATDPQKHRVVGAVSNVRWQAPYLVADLVCWDAQVIARIQDGSQREISCAYRYRAINQPGTVNGESFDLKMADLIGNHVALVPEGRVGRDVVVADSALDLEIECDHRGNVRVIRRPVLAADIEIEIDFADRIKGYRRLPIR